MEPSNELEFEIKEADNQRLYQNEQTDLEFEDINKWEYGVQVVSNELNIQDQNVTQAAARQEFSSPRSIQVQVEEINSVAQNGRAPVLQVIEETGIRRFDSRLCTEETADSIYGKFSLPTLMIGGIIGRVNLSKIIQTLSTRILLTSGSNNNSNCKIIDRGNEVPKTH
ncbi:unnamed protein product [Fraxinus pennsylvanica]|uniref:Uncharacterized protein n=1 Tax=Fraxinus pennsylvanica TaxID=56036 RepID=A0AAD1Z5V6_9LAMI|nr:unnamed protein product [Fraxinus pennsylvanica]